MAVFPFLPVHLRSDPQEERITAIGHRLTAIGRAKDSDTGNRVVNCGDVRSPYNPTRFTRPIG